jgi:gliding motility associated protien GldN
MKTQFFSICLLISLVVGSTHTGTAQENKVLDGVFIKETAPTRRVIPYTHVREADVMYYKRVWREIDLREKMNHPLYYPTQPIQEIGYTRMSLYDIILEGVQEGTITAYEEDGVGGQFQVALTKSEAEEAMTETSILQEEDLETGILKEVEVKSMVEAWRVKKYWLKEDWFFDRERSVMEVRIIGLLPVIEELNEDGTFKALKGLFWIYFPEARYVFANHEVYNTMNDGSRITFEDYFRKRMFSSYIRSETNVYNNRVLESYVKGVDRLLEARQIEQEIINFEHDLWQY